MDRMRAARVYLSGVLALNAAIRQSTRMRELVYPSVAILFELSMRDGVAVETLARRLSRTIGDLSVELALLRELGLVEEASCSASPELCPARPARRPCGRHRLQFLTELGRAEVESWAGPYLAQLTAQDPALWPLLAERLQNIKPKDEHWMKTNRRRRAKAMDGRKRVNGARMSRPSEARKHRHAA
jgi:hypothetical protein